MPKLISTIVMGIPAYDNGHDFDLVPVIVGFTLHELTSAGMGVVYARMICQPALGRHLLVTAVSYGFLACAVAQWFLIPWLSPTMAQHTAALLLAIGHLIFGLVLAFYAYWLVRDIG